jgi:uncharacterized protein (DUF433 family)
MGLSAKPGRRGQELPASRMSRGIWYNAITMVTKQRSKQDRIVRIPGLVGGKPVIKGTRIPVDLILERLASDLDFKTLFEDYPDLTEEDIKACIAYAKELVEDEEAFPTDEEDVTQAHL